MSTTDRSTVVGVFTERGVAERALEELHNAGFQDDQIGFITPHRDAVVPPGTVYSDPVDTDEPNTATAYPALGAVAPSIGSAGTVSPYGGGTTGAAIVPPAVTAGDADETYVDDDVDTASGAATGAVGGGVLGGIIGAAAALLIPGFGPAIAGGILAATLGGAALGALTGGLVGALTGMGIPEEEARYYHDELAAGKTVVTVNAPGRYEEALSILRTNGATDASERYAGTTTYAPTATGTETVDTTTPYPPQSAYDPTMQPNYSSAATDTDTDQRRASYDPTLQPNYSSAATDTNTEQRRYEAAQERATTETSDEDYTPGVPPRTNPTRDERA